MNSKKQRSPRQMRAGGSFQSPTHEKAESVQLLAPATNLTSLCVVHSTEKESILKIKILTAVQWGYPKRSHPRQNLKLTFFFSLSYHFC